MVRGLGSEQSFFSASHGAGRRMSRSKARKLFTEEDLIAQTQGVEFRKDRGVVDEIPAAYKDINEVIAAQTDLRRGRRPPAPGGLRQKHDRRKHLHGSSESPSCRCPQLFPEGDVFAVSSIGNA